MILILYIIGAIISYYLFRFDMKKIDAWDYQAFTISIIISLLSWLGVIVGIIALLDNIKTKPPKWL